MEDRNDTSPSDALTLSLERVEGNQKEDMSDDGITNESKSLTANDHLFSKMNAVVSRLEQQEGIIDQMYNESKSQNSKIEQQESKIEQIENENKSLLSKVEDLEAANKDLLSKVEDLEDPETELLPHNNEISTERKKARIPWREIDNPSPDDTARDASGSFFNSIKSLRLPSSTRSGERRETIVRIDREKQEKEKELRLNHDVFSYFVCYKANTLPFLTSVVVFGLQMSLAVLFVWGQLDVSNEKNPFQVAPDVDVNVRICHVLTLLVAVLTQGTNITFEIVIF